MKFLETMENAVRQIVADEVKSQTRELRTTEKGSRPWNRQNAKWEKGEEEILIQRVSVFLDHCALAHRRKRGGIVARLQKMLREDGLCGLKTTPRINTNTRPHHSRRKP